MRRPLGRCSCPGYSMSTLRVCFSRVCLSTLVATLWVCPFPRACWPACHPVGMMARAICGVEDMLSLLSLPKASADKQSKGVFNTTISFLPEGQRQGVPQPPLNWTCKLQTSGRQSWSGPVPWPLADGDEEGGGLHSTRPATGLLLVLLALRCVASCHIGPAPAVQPHLRLLLRWQAQWPEPTSNHKSDALVPGMVQLLALAQHRS